VLSDRAPGRALHIDGDRVREDREDQAMLARPVRKASGLVVVIVGEPDRRHAGLERREGLVVGHRRGATVEGLCYRRCSGIPGG
jgi:hypothetical protein